VAKIKPSNFNPRRSAMIVPHLSPPLSDRHLFKMC
jgi:hypothetical protein